MVNDGSRKIYLARWYLDPNEKARNMFNILASSNNIELIEDFLDGVLESHHVGNDPHPSAEGQEIIAGNFFNALKPYLEANNLIK